MVCELPQKLKDKVEKYKECFRTLSIEGTSRERTSGGFWADYVRECEEDRKAGFAPKGSGVERIDEGVHRDVYSFKSGRGDDCVVKIARSDHEKALGANRNEWKAWNSLRKDPDARKLFMPVTDADPKGWWLTMPLAGSPERGESYVSSPYRTRTTRMTPTHGMKTVRTPGGEKAYTYTTIYPSGGESGGQVAADALEEEVREAGYSCRDVHRGNIGYYKGRNVIIDYGMGVEAGSGAKCSIRTPSPRERRTRTRPRRGPTLTRFD